MPKISDEEFEKVLIRLWKKDYDAIKRMATAEVSATQIIRDAISQFVRAANDRARKRIDATSYHDPTNPFAPLETGIPEFGGELK